MTPQMVQPTPAKAEQQQIYKAANLNSREVDFVQKLVARLADQLAELDAKIDSLKKSTKAFNETLIDHVNMVLEKADILTKYYYDDQYQPHNPLPGIVAVPSPYNISEVKADNQKVEEINELLNKLEDQKNIMQKMMQDDFESTNDAYVRAMTLSQALAEGLVSVSAEFDT